MDPKEGIESRPPSTGDVITQQELAAQLIFQNVEYPSRASLMERFQNGAQIEPGPLTIVQPYFDLGPFIIPAFDNTRRAAQIRQCIHDANRALSDIDEHDSADEFRRIAPQIAARIKELIEARNNASFRARNWDGFRARVRDQVYACEITWMLWAATKCVGYGLTSLAVKTFGIACARATILAAA
ncbi:MAG: hypothetical protein WB992_02435 [Bryobacteraceae bacterium]